MEFWPSYGVIRRTCTNSRQGILQSCFYLCANVSCRESQLTLAYAPFQKHIFCRLSLCRHRVVRICGGFHILVVFSA